MRFHRCIFSCHASGTLSANRYSVDSFCLPFWYFSPSPRCRGCIADRAVGVGTSQSITAFDQLWPSVIVSICCKTKLLWWGPRATLTVGLRWVFRLWLENTGLRQDVSRFFSVCDLWTWIVDYVSSTRNEFPLIEWSLSSVRQLLATPNIKWYCTIGISFWSSHCCGS